MGYRSILVHLDASDRASTQLDVAIGIAVRHGAWLSALFTPTSPEWHGPFLLTVSAEEYEHHRKLLDTRRQALEHLFLDRLHHEKLGGQWQAVPVHDERELLHRARLADLIVVGQANPNDPDSLPGSDIPLALTLASGRPVLWVPSSGRFPTVGDRIVVAWDAGYPATRAVYDALPFLEHAKQTTLVTVDTPATHDVPADGGIAASLARHGVPVDVETLHAATDAAIGDILLARAEQTGCDLLVMGAYGHARWKEIVPGGVTRTVLKTMTMPVLMSH